jgi:hypothetical protein
MNFHLPISNAPLIAGSFGLGLILAGRYILGISAIFVAGAAFFLVKPSLNPKTDHQRPSNSETHVNEPPPIDNWFFEKDGVAVGPLLESEILALMKSEEISNETLVYNSAVSEKWVSLDDTHFIKRNHHRGY